MIKHESFSQQNKVCYTYLSAIAFAETVHLMYCLLCLTNCTINMHIFLGKNVSLVEFLLSKRYICKTFRGINNKLREFDLKEYLSVLWIDYAKAVYIAAFCVFLGVTIKCCYFNFLVSQICNKS